MANSYLNIITFLLTTIVYYFIKPENPPSDEWLKKERQFNQDFTKKFKPNTLDKGKEVTWPSQQPKGYNMNNPLSQKYRT
jgi:hypothetical protein